MSSNYKNVVKINSTVENIVTKQTDKSHTSRELLLEEKLLQESSRKKILETFVEKKSIGPMVIELDPTTACNLACHDCISANLLNQGGFEKGRLIELAKDFKKIGVRAVVLIGGGEPMAHPEFSILVNYLTEEGIDVGLTTNGTLIDKHFDAALKTKWLRVSVDAGSDEIFSDFRPHKSGKSFFGKVVENMKRFAEKKTGKLGYSFLILSKYDKNNKFISTNAVDIYRAAKISKEIGCDYFEVKPAFDIMHYLQKNDLKVTEEVNSQLIEAKKIEDDNFKVISPYTLDEALQNTSTQIKDYDHCNVAQLRTVVSPSGVYVCPYHRGNLQMKIGNANKELISDIWKSEKRETVMNMLDPKKHCAFHCIRHNSNKLVEKIINFENQQVLKDFDLFI